MPKVCNDASSKGSLALVFPTLSCPRSCPGLFTRRSPPRLFTAAARAGLRSAPESRSRGAHPHLLRNFTTRVLFHLRLLPCFCSTHHVPLSRPHLLKERRSNVPERSFFPAARLLRNAGFVHYLGSTSGGNKGQGEPGQDNHSPRLSSCCLGGPLSAHTHCGDRPEAFLLPRCAAELIAKGTLSPHFAPIL